MRIAIVDDEESIRVQVKNLVESYCKEKAIFVECVLYAEAVSLLKHYKANFDAIFFDIKMPGYNGLEAAELLRKQDTNTAIVFITNLKQYAIRGYSVDAIAFVAKPIVPYDFFVLMNKIVQKGKLRSFNSITVKTQDGIKMMDVRDILYIETIKHRLIFHTVQGDTETWGTLIATEEQLPKNAFSRCNVCFLVNLQHVHSINKDIVMVGTIPLKIARSRKQEFMDSLAKYNRFGGV